MEEEEIMERRLQARGGSLTLTLPQKIVKSMGLVRGQSVRFSVADGGLMLRPTIIESGSVDEAESGKYERAIDRMMKNNAESGRPAGTKAAPARSKLERLMIK